jgi:hypothetical protein
MGFILALLFAIITVAIGNSKGYSGVGCFFAGLFLGPVAIIILAFLPDKIEQEKEREKRDFVFRAPFLRRSYSRFVIWSAQARYSCTCIRIGSAG